ncbi:putative nucleotidyltransferase, ribonuclease H [Tanacetum coccineum]
MVSCVLSQALHFGSQSTAFCLLQVAFWAGDKLVAFWVEDKLAAFCLSLRFGVAICPKIEDPFARKSNLFSKCGKVLGSATLRKLVIRESRLRALLNKLFRFTGTNLNFSMSFHPQTDRQTERVNALLELYLRHYVSANQHDWAKLLDVAQLSYNMQRSEATGKSPF